MRPIPPRPPCATTIRLPTRRDSRSDPLLRRQVLGALLQGDGYLLRLSGCRAYDPNPDSIADLVWLDRFTDVSLIADLSSIDFEDDVVRIDSCQTGRALRHHVPDHDAAICRKPERKADALRHRTERDSQPWL